MKRQSTEDFKGSETSLYDTAMVDTCHYTLFKPIECTTSRVNLNVNYGLWAIMCQCRFISCNKWLTGEAVHVGGQGTCGESLYLLLNFIVNPKLLQKNKIYFLKKQLKNYQWLDSRKIN